MTAKKKQTDEAAVEEKVVETDTGPSEASMTEGDQAETSETAIEVTDDGTVAADESSSGDNGAAPATEFEASGAPVQVVADVDPSHPAVDNDPRAGTTVDQNRIDFNDPGLSGSEAVERALNDQAGTN